MSATVSAVRSPCSVSPSTAETSPPPRSRAWKRARSPRSAAGPVSATSATAAGKAIPASSGPQARERRRRCLLAHSALAPMPSPGQRRIRTADRPGEGEHGDVNERPGEPGVRRRGENHEQEERWAERQLALARETAEAPSAESDIRSTDGAAQRRATPAAKTNPSRKPVSATLPPRGTRAPRSPDTGRRLRRARRQRAARVDRTGRAEGDSPDDHRLERVASGTATTGHGLRP